MDEPETGITDELPGGSGEAENVREFWDMKRLRWFAPTEELRNEVAEMFTANFKRAQKNHAEGIPRGVVLLSPLDRHAAESR